MNSRWAFLTVSAVQRALPFLILPFVTSAMGVEEYGRATVLVATFIFVSMVFGLGTEAAAYRFHAMGDARDRFVASGWAARILPPLLGAVLAAIVLLGNLSIATTSPLALATTIFAASLYASSWQWPAAVLRIDGRVRRYYATAIVYAVLLAAAKLAFVVLLGWGSLGWSLADLAGALVLLALTFDVYLSNGLRRVARRDLAAVLRLGLPLTINQVALWISNSLDRILVATLVSIAAAGTYGLATQFAGVGAAVAIELTKYLLPRIRATTGSDAGPVESLGPQLRRHILLVSLTGVAVVVAGIVVPPLLFPAGFHGIGAVVAGLAIPTVLYGSAWIASDLLSIGYGRTRYIAIVSSLGAVATVAINLVLIPALGTWGAVITAGVCGLGVLLAFWTPIAGIAGRRRTLVMLAPMLVAIAAFACTAVLLR